MADVVAVPGRSSAQVDAFHENRFRAQFKGIGVTVTKCGAASVC